MSRNVPEYDIASHRQPLGDAFLPWPEVPGCGREFRKGLMRYEDVGMFYSYGPEWHHGILGSDSNGFLPNCYYRVNSDGMHWDEYVHNPDVLALGCSVTAGVGLPYEYTWPNIYRYVVGCSVNSVARPGASIQTMVKSAFHHIKHYGAPKKIMMLIPDAMRYTFLHPVKANINSTPKKSILFWDKKQYSYVEGGDNSPPFIYHDDRKIPILPSPDFLVEQNLSSLESLGYLCDILNIDIVLHFNSEACGAQFQSLGWTVINRISEKNYTFEPQGQNHELFWHSGWDTTTETAHSPHPGLESHLIWASEFIGQEIQPDEWKDITPWARALFDHDIPHPVHDNKSSGNST